MQKVDGLREPVDKPRRYERGVKNLNPKVVEKIQKELSQQPTQSKSELARKVGVSRQTLLYYLRALPKQTEALAKENIEIQKRNSINHLALLENIQSSANDIQKTIGQLKGVSFSLENASAIFKGYAVLEKYFRLLGELLGEVSPPATNLYITKVEALLNSSIDVKQLPPAIQQVLGSKNGAS